MTVYNSLPNLITLARLGLVPVVIAMISAGRWPIACLIFIIAGLSDAVDGWLAKTFNLRTELGAYLDPVADKALLVSIYVALSVYGAVPSWLTIAVVARDVMIIGALIISLADEQARRHSSLVDIQGQHGGADRFRRGGARRQGVFNSRLGRGLSSPQSP